MNPIKRWWLKKVVRAFPVGEKAPEPSLGKYIKRELRQYFSFILLFLVLHGVLLAMLALVALSRIALAGVGPTASMLAEHSILSLGLILIIVMTHPVFKQVYNSLRRAIRAWRLRRQSTKSVGRL